MDPVFSERASPVASFGPRRAPPHGLSLAQLPRIDVVLQVLAIGQTLRLPRRARANPG
jgi:hypothetical protein